MRDPKGLAVFEKADELVISVYRLTTCMPPEEKYSLTQQIHRAAVSIPSNLVEGCSRSSERDFARFVEIALGSSMELEYQLGLAVRLVEMSRQEMLTTIVSPLERETVTKRTQAMMDRFEPTIELAAEVTRMLVSFNKKLRSDS